MISLINPYNGEKGFFCSIREKEIIDAILMDFSHDVGDDALD